MHFTEKGSKGQQSVCNVIEALLLRTINPRATSQLPKKISGLHSAVWTKVLYLTSPSCVFTNQNAPKLSPQSRWSSQVTVFLLPYIHVTYHVQ